MARKELGTAQRDQMLREALAQMEHALDLLDESGQALDVAAHLDLAIVRLRETLDASSDPERAPD